MRRLLASLLLALAAALPARAAADVPTETPVVVRTYPHDRTAFTEGLFYLDGYLYESTGYVGHSSVRKVVLASGRVVQQAVVPPPYFGEGIAPWKDQIVSLSWQQGQGFRWTRAGFRRVGQVRYAGEGWGMTSDGRALIMSDGTPRLRVLDPASFAVRRTIDVTVGGAPVRNLNELEWVDGEILANIWMTDLIARIDPQTGRVKGWIDISALHRRAGVTGQDAVANGIAWDAKGRRLFVTGKNWPLVFELAWPRHG